ncbi:MAG TPA: sigma-54 dependent transcriptional regulator [Verrucomicrobiae bacterium]|jgi:two-component system nitrogen regulation response regulator GlnG|nr:sigma-54 dependent transcriptional regulator [Verrucomicrobiae bacterium]
MDKLLLVDDEADVQYSFRRIFDSPDIELTTASSGEEALQAIPGLKPNLVVMDVRMGGLNGLETLRRIRQVDTKLPVIMMTAYGTTQTAIEAMKLGAYDYLLKPFDVPKLKEIIFGALKAARDMKRVVSYQPLLESEDYELGVVGRSEPMQKVFKMIGQLAASDATALITGESGTGKELVARAIYHHSKRSQMPFLAINCAAIPENLLESELFGHERGAFTGAANQRIGKFEQCSGGTIFLDEIGDMSLPTQTKILRVLQNGTFERVGGNQSVKVDVRVIAATNKPLEKAVANKEFREDLFYRLNVVRIEIPPLRERSEDIRLLVNYFLKKFAQSQNQTPKSISAEALELLERYPWPGNVRELENVIQRAIVVTKGEVILPIDFPPGVLQPLPRPVQSATSAAAPTAPAADAAMEHNSANNVDDLTKLARTLFTWARSNPSFKVIPSVERELIINALAETKGNQVQAAKLLGITRATLRKRVDKFKIRQELSVH